MKKTATLIPLVIILLAFLPITPHSSATFSSLSYKVSMKISSIISLQYNGTVNFYVNHVNSSVVNYTVIGYGSIYQFANQHNINLTELFRITMYNGTYLRQIGYGNGFPMFSKSQIQNITNSSYVKITTFNTPLGTFKAYEISLQENTVEGSGVVTIWVNQSNYVILGIYEQASSLLGSITLNLIITGAKIGNSNNNTSENLTTTSANHIVNPTITLGTSSTDSLRSNLLFILVPVIVIIIILIIFLLKRK